MWEYTILRPSSWYFKSVLTDLNRLGAEGWEAVSIAPVEWEVDQSAYAAKGTPVLEVLLKRRIDTLSEPS
jgi:hypothetical protein